MAASSEIAMLFSVLAFGIIRNNFKRALRLEELSFLKVKTYRIISRNVTTPNQVLVRMLF